MKVTKRSGIIGAASLAAATLIGIFALSGPTVVPVGANLQEYIDNASAGTTLQLEPDGVYSGNFTMRSDVAIKSVGTRTVGAAFGKTFNVGAKISSPNAGSAVFIPPGTVGVTIDGVEITHAGFVYNIIVIGSQGTQQDTAEEAPRNNTLNNIWVRGHPTEHSQNGIVDNGSNTRVTDSRIDNIHGVGVESHGILSYNGPGPFHYSGNHIEAAAINIMFGGADPSIQGMVPTDIQILRNYLFKPLSWKVGDPSYAGIHWSIKNLLEFKMARNVIVDGNVLENSWGDAQIGYCSLYTVRNQDGKAPWATLENITVSNNAFKNCEQGLQLLGKDSPNVSERANGLRFFNNQFINIANRWLTMSGYYNVTFEHNTHLQGGNVTALYGEPSLGFTYKNNVTVKSGYGFFGDGIGEGNAAIAKYLPDAEIAGNVIAGANPNFYPAHNFYPANLDNLGSLIGTDGKVPGYLPELPPLPSPSTTATVTVPPQPTPSVTIEQPSVDNTRIPTALKIVDDRGAVWTLSGIKMLRNGLDTGGYGSSLLWCGGRVYGKGEDLQWWQYLNPGWSRVGADPCTSPSPSPTATATPSQTPTPTATATPTPTPTPTPRPVLPACQPNQIIGNPAKCLCVTGVKCAGKDARCQ